MLAVAPAGASRRRLSLLSPLFPLLLAAISWATGLTLAANNGPLDLPPLAAPAGQWLEAARETAPGDEPNESGVHALLLEIEYRFDEDRRADYHYRLVYQIVSPGAVRPWSTVSRSWRPWFEERPEVRARVISPDGEEKYLDASNLGEYSESESGPDVYGDTLTLRGPLPTLGVGSIVEEVHVVRDRTPYFDAGTAKQLVLQMHVPLHRARVVLDYPAGLPLRWTTYELPGIEVDRKERDGRVRITFEDGPFEARGYPEPLAPSDVPDGPALEFSTAESWNAVATAYARVVDEQLGSPALTKLTRRATRGADGREQIVGRLVDLLHERVRYTAVAFGEQALIPVSPETTIDRGFGDCKDKSTLLVGLLGEAGISAHVALLSTGPGPDVNPELPGLGAFDHAIVYVPGDEPLWIDPTDPYARPGELPEVDQGRLALIAAPDTEALLRTPASLPVDNLLSETRDVFLPDLGNARIVETGRVTGEFDRTYRYSFADATNDELRGYFTEYVRSGYAAEELGILELGDVNDTSEPHVLRVEALRAGVAVSDLAEAAVAVPTGGLLSHLPDTLIDSEGPERTHDLVLSMPYVAEWRYRIHAPAGFSVDQKPAAGVESFGPATLTTSLAERDDDVLELAVRFDAGKSRYTPEEVREFRQALVAFERREMPTVLFYQRGEAHLAAGRTREAIAEFRTLADDAPEVALHRARVARALLAAGLGDQARAEARRATELDPESGHAWWTLGFVLAHDLLGRKFHAGFDLTGSIAAYRRALDIEPDEFTTRGELAIVLEHGKDGQRYGADADIDGAIETYRKLREELETTDLDQNLMVALLRAERFDELRDLSRESIGIGDGAALLLVSIAAIEGTDAAIREATRVTGDPASFRQTLVSAAENLVQSRRYEEAAALMRAGARGSADAVALQARAGMLANVRRTDEADDEAGGPETAVRRLFAFVFSGKSVADFSDLFALPVRDVLARESPDELDAIFDFARAELLQQGLPVEVVADLVLSLAHFTSEGDDDRGYRVVLKLDAVPEMDNIVSYVVREEAEYRILAIGNVPGFAGAAAIDALEAGRDEVARGWIDRAWGDVGTGGEDELTTHPLRLLWTRDEAATAAEMRLAAGTLIVEVDETRGRRILEAAREGAGSDDDRLAIDLALLRGAMEVDEPGRAATYAARLLESRPDSEWAFLVSLGTLLATEDLSLARSLIDRRLEADPDDFAARRSLAELEGRSGRLDLWREGLAALIASGEATASEYNNLAWLDVVDDRVSEETLGHAQRAVMLEQYSAPASLHTLATVYAELDRTDEARDALLRALDSRAVTDELQSPDWYIIGRIAEAYGALQAARAAYGRVELPGVSTHVTASTWTLAARRLAALDADETD